jgi:hypothetical protein
MKNCDSHVYLYAKHWYKRDPDIFVDLKKIYSLRNGVDAEYLNNRDVLSCLLNLTVKHIENNSRLILDFISDIDPKNTWKVGYRPVESFSRDENPLTKVLKYDFEYAVAYKCLSVLSLTKISNIPEGLDEVDPTVLPLA